MTDQTQKKESSPKLEARGAVIVAFLAMILAVLMLFRSCGLEDASGTPFFDSIPVPDSEGSEGSVCTSEEASAQGATCPKGADGNRGATGPAGPKGDRGFSGEEGGQGASGTDGADGKAGLTGPSGVDGIPGPVGPQGPAGTPGNQGPAGETGPQGQQGVPGDGASESSISIGDPCPLFHQNGDTTGVVRWLDEGNKSSLQCVAP